MAARVHAFGWHVLVQLDGRDLPQHEATIRRLPCKVVIDHIGKFLEPVPVDHPSRSEEHTSELQSLMRISYAVFCLKKNTTNNKTTSSLLHIKTQIRTRQRKYYRTH